MARRKTRTLTEVELEVMQVVWAREQVTSEDVSEALRSRGRSLSGGTVRKMLSILVRKGYLSRSRKGHSFFYKAKVSQDEATGKMAEDLLTRAFGGRAGLMVAALLDSRAVRKRDLDEIKRIIAAAEQGEHE